MKVRWGIIGLGQMGQCFAKASHPVAHSELIAVASTDESKLKDFVNRHGVKKKYAFKSYSELMNCHEVDAVYIALTNNLHFDMIVQGIDCQKNILVEKPATLNAKEMLSVHHRMDHASTIFSEAFAYLHHPVAKKYLDMIRDGAIGRPLRMKTAFGCKISSGRTNFLKSLFQKEGRHFNRNLGGGCILDLGCYLTSLSRIIAKVACEGHELDATFVNKKHFFGSKKVEIDATAEISFNGGFTSSVRASFTDELGQNTTISGTNGEIIIENTWNCDHKGFFLNGNFQRIENLHYDNPYSYQIHNFSNWIIEKKTMPQYPSHTLEDTFLNMRMLDNWKKL